MEECSAQVKQQIMQRVENIYVWRTYTKPLVIECAMLGAVIGGSAFLVSFNNILNNALRDPSISSLYQFAYHAFEETEFSIKVLSIAGLILTFIVVKDMIVGVSIVSRKIRQVFPFKIIRFKV
jgi:hypothetical protein